MSKKFTDEGKNHTIDFSKADFATEKMHSDYKLISGSLLKDIDWVATVEGDLVDEWNNSDIYSKYPITAFPSAIEIR